jgi:hypothetical protein
MFKRSDAVFVMGFYNIVAGVVFFFLYERIFKLFGIEAYTPAHAPAIQVPCLFLVVFGIGYLWASRDLVRNRALLFVGLLQNVGITALALWYWYNQPELMHLVYLLPAGISVLFAIMFLVAWAGTIVEAGRQRRRAKVVPAAAVAHRAEPPAAPEPEARAPAAPEPVERSEEVTSQEHEEVIEPREPEASTEPTLPGGELPPRSPAEGDQSDTPYDKPPPTPSA